jgi:hypothetical protein
LNSRKFANSIHPKPGPSFHPVDLDRPVPNPEVPSEITNTVLDKPEKQNQGTMLNAFRPREDVLPGDPAARESKLPDIAEHSSSRRLTRRRSKKIAGENFL